MKLTWYESAGGPLLVLPRAALADWQGTDGDDYERACAVQGYADIVRIEGREALVLGDEPFPTAVFRRGLPTMFARWYAAPDHASARAALQSFEARAWPVIETHQWQNSSEDLVVIDAAWPGGEAEIFDEVSLAIGRWTVSIHAFRPNRETSLFVYVLAP